MSEVVALPREEGEDRVWEVRRDDVVLGTARIATARGGFLLTGLEVPADDAFVALDALLSALRLEGADSLSVDVAADDAVSRAAVDGRDTRLLATQMLLDLTGPVAAPARVVLRPMATAEFAGYRDQLVTAYAHEMHDAGYFGDLGAALASSERSTGELLPDGLDSPGHHLWTAHDGETPVAILWIHVDGEKAYIYDIEVRADQRRRGYGREVLDAGALAARELGAAVLGLNVFGHNDGALALYEQAGYATTEQTFRVSVEGSG